MKWRSAWPIFHGTVILPYIFKTIWCKNIILWDYESVWPNMWPQNKCRSLTYIPWFSRFALYLEKCLMYEDHTSGLWVWPDVWPQNILRTLWPIFHGQWFCLTSWKLLSGWTSYFGIINQYDLTSDLKIFVGHYDLYFMVHWICLISYRLFYVWTTYFGIMSLYDMPFDLKINVGHCDLYFMVQRFCLIS